MAASSEAAASASSFLSIDSKYAYRAIDACRGAAAASERASEHLLNMAHVVNGNTYGVRDGSVICFAASLKSETFEASGNHS